MTNIRRYFREGNIYFLTHVTYNRAAVLVKNSDLFWQAVEKTHRDTAFDLVAWVILPDHVHLLVDPKDNDLSLIMKRIKLSLSTNLRGQAGVVKGRLWQYRFWDHVIRDLEDMNRHIDYIHYNPVKHRLVTDPFEWEHSSIHGYRENGYYEPGWGVLETIEFIGEYGE